MKLTSDIPIKEQLNLAHPLRTYFDDGSHQYNATPVEEKVNTLARIVNEGFDLYAIVKQYKQNYRLPGYKHIIDNVSLTLREHISYLATGSTCDWDTLSALEEASDKEITRLLTELLKEFILKSYNAASLVLSYVDYKFNDKPEEYKRISKFLNMDLDAEDQFLDHALDAARECNYDEEVTENVEKYLQWDYSLLHVFLKEIALPDLEEKDLVTFSKGYCFDHDEIRGISKISAYFMNKHYPKDKRDRLRFDRDFRNASALRLAINIVEVLYFDKPLFDYNVFHIKNEFMRPGFIGELFENDQAALLVQEDFRDLENNPEIQKDEVYRKNRMRFINLWDELNTSLAKKNTLIIASYRGCDKVKIGLMRRGAQIVSDPVDPTYRILQLQEVKEFKSRKHVILDRLIRSRAMLNRITGRTDYVASTYYGKEVSVRYENLSAYSIKLMCMEWLRTRLAPKKYRIKYVSKVSRKDYTNADISAITADNKRLTAKVVFLDHDVWTLEELKRFRKNKSPLKLIFSESDIDVNLPVYNTRDIFSQLAKSDHRFFLANLVGD